MKINTLFFIISRSFLYNVRNIFAQICRGNPNTHFMFNSFLENRNVCVRKCGKISYSRTSHDCQYGACALYAVYLRLQTHTHNMCGTHSLSLTPRRYNPCRVLAHSRSRLHSSLSLSLALQFLPPNSRSRLQPSLSLALALQFLTPNFSASFFTPSIHLRFGLPARLLPSGLSKVIFLH